MNQNISSSAPCKVPSRPQKIQLSAITTDAGTQCRAGLDQGVVSDYADAMKAGDKFPPIVVFTDGKTYWPADGFHRAAAMMKNGGTEIHCDVRKGTRQDAIKFALGANAIHGLRRTNADKRKAVELALAEWPTLSSAEIARLCAVSHPTVENIRREVQPVKFTGSPRIGADGKTRAPAIALQPDDFQRFERLAHDDRLVVETALTIFYQQGRAVSPDDVVGLIDRLEQLARN
jgi:uncharacterized ParB-like nuclease family protein